MAVAIMGITAFMVPLALKIFNSLSYVQQFSQLNSQARGVMWQMNHEIENAAKVEIGTDPNTIKIWVYDFKQYSDDENLPKTPNVYEERNMFLENVTVPAGTKVLNIFETAPAVAIPTVAKNWGEITYTVMQENPYNDWNRNGKYDPKPYLYKKTIWHYQVPGLRGNGANPVSDLIFHETFFNGRIEMAPPYDPTKPDNPRTFTRSEFGQIYTVAFRLRPAYSKPSDPPRVYTGVMTARTPRS
jgi:hypothetical protein